MIFIFNTLYTIIIAPLVQIIDFVFALSQRVFANPSISVLAVSAATSLLCLPLYAIAEHYQQIERDTQKKLKNKIRKIKSAFKSDEQYMMLQAYYRQNHYHPMYALRSTFGLLIQIPFFIAAYSYLSHLEILNGARFLAIADLGAGDALIQFAGMHINLLPILMTAINVIAAVIYTRDFPLRDKIQLFGIAAVFLVLLYNAPAGLVLYWTANNVFSLVKHVLYKIKNPKKTIWILASAIVFLIDLYVLFIHTGELHLRILTICAATFILLLPIIINKIRAVGVKPYDANNCLQLFFINAAALTFLAGLVIPCIVIASSPQEFSFIDSAESPFTFIAYAFFISFGSFFFWPSCIALLFKKKIEPVLAVLFSLLLLYSIINLFVFPGNYGTISNTFQFDTPALLKSGIVFTTVLNLFSIILVTIGFIILIRKNYLQKLIAIFSITLVVIAGLSVPYIVSIQKEYLKLAIQKPKKQSNDDQKNISNINPVFSLSKTNKNVIIIMADRAINGFVKPVFDEYPLLYTQFDGFTLFPNTVSFSAHTVMGVPPIWGGYEYTPIAMNERGNIPLKEKHNEALLMLPILFSNEGFHVTVTDPSWANYSWVPDTTIYKDLKNVNAINTLGHYKNIWLSKNNFSETNLADSQIKENIFWFSLFKMSPPAIRSLIYNEGSYWKTPHNKADELVIDSYSVLDFLSELTTYNADYASALFITNELTHENIFFQYPDYILVKKVTNKGKGAFAESTTYHTNAAFYHRLGEYLDELKKNNVYDNTRIIIVSDHGSNVDAGISGDDFTIRNKRRERYNPVLLVKDFNAHGQLSTEMSFMTNADVPMLATKDIIENPVNPATGKILLSDQKQKGVFITNNDLFIAHRHNKNTFKINDDEWIFVHDNIFDPANWTEVQH
ncbi:MAG: YidC/Oxa1 family membrane protein insertase [Termitinemataceae bacterium]|nr:MAG: YidC/Oxa1 family membrane protein insertase [Termitinemataceae bacterium]